MKTIYYGHRFPSEIISHTVWLYHRFTLGFRNIEDLLAERGIVVTYETIRQWCQKFGLNYAKKLRKKQGKLSDTWYADEASILMVNVSICGVRSTNTAMSLISSFKADENKKAALRVFRNILKGQSATPRKIVTDKLRSYGAARKEVMPSVTHCQDRYANNRTEGSHQPTRQQERQMRGFKSPGHAQRFLSVHSQVHNLFNVGRHLLKARHYRILRARSFSVWRDVTCAC